MEGFWDIFTKIIIAIVAIYGAYISTYNLLLSRKNTNVGAKVELKYSSYRVGSGVLTSNEFSINTPELVVTITNIKKPIISIQTPFFYLPKKKGKLLCFNPMSQHKFPAELSEGKYAMVFYSSIDIANRYKESGVSNSINLVAYCEDTLGHIYKSKPLIFNVDEILSKGTR